jgi:hypothetical protein
MKTVLALSIALAGVAGATTMTEACGFPTTFGGSGVAISGAQGPASFVCASIGVPDPTAIISQIQLFYSADYSFGSTPGINTVIWTYNTGSGTWSGSNTETVTGGFTSSSNNPGESAGALDPPYNGAVVGAGQIDTTDLGVGTNTFLGVNVLAPVSITGGVISTTGALYAQITYSTPSAAPEPATLSLMGSALVGLGFLARRKK